MNRLGRVMRGLVALWFLPALLAGCNWFSGGKPVQPVSPLPILSNPVNGSVVWRRDTGDGNELERLTAVSWGGRIFAADEDGIVSAYEATSGGALWSADTDTQITGGVGAGDSLVLVGTAEGQVIALDSGSGNERWRHELSSEILAAPAVGNGVVVARTNDGKVMGLSAADGSWLWTFQREVPVLSLRGSATPVVAGDHVICGMDGGRLVSLEMGTGRSSWEVLVAYPTGRSDLSRVVDIDGAPLVLGNSVYVTTFQGHMAAVDLNSGEIQWSIPFSSYNGVGAGANALFATDDKGYLWAVEPSTGETLWTQRALSGRRLSPPTGLQSWVAVGDLEGYVHWVDAATGDIVGRTQAVDSAVRARMPVDADNLLVMGTEGEVASIRAPSP